MRTLESPRLCELCGRLVRKGTTRHHLIPRTCRKNRWFKKNFTREEMNTTVDLCRECHDAVHRFVPREKELGRYFSTLETLKQHPEIANFLNWVRKQK